MSKTPRSSRSAGTPCWAQRPGRTTALACPEHSMHACASDHTGTPAGAGVPQSIHQIAAARRRAPNGLPFSSRKRATKAPIKNRTISRAQRSAGTACWAGWPPALACSPHDRTTPARNHGCITSVRWNHATHAITSGTTGHPHHAPSNHACTTSTGTTSLAQRACTSESSACDQPGMADHAAPAAQRVAHQPRRPHRSESHRAETNLQNGYDLGAA